MFLAERFIANVFNRRKRHFNWTSLIRPSQFVHNIPNRWLPLLLNWSGIGISDQRFVSSIFVATHFSKKPSRTLFAAETLPLICATEIEFEWKAIVRTNAVLIKFLKFYRLHLPQVSKQRHSRQPSRLNRYSSYYNDTSLVFNPDQSNPIQSDPIQLNTIWHYLLLKKK